MNHNRQRNRYNNNNSSNNNSSNNNNISNVRGPSIPVSHFYQQNAVSYQIEQITIRHLDLIDDLSYEYSRNMRSYSQNMTDMIDCLRSSQSILNNSLLANNSIPRARSLPTPTRNTTRNVNVNTNTNTNTNDPPNMLFSYFFYPHDDHTVNNVDPNTPTVMTNDQIQRATRTIRYTNNIIANSCPISLEEFVIGESIIQINYCGHVFKTQPLMNWFRRDHRCPVCRANLITSPNIRNPIIPIPIVDNINIS